MYRYFPLLPSANNLFGTPPYTLVIILAVCETTTNTLHSLLTTHYSLMQYWLVKQEPEQYPWAQFVKDKGTYWDGVRNYQARNNRRAMRVGDRVLY